MQEEFLGKIFGLNHANGGTKRLTKDFLIKNQGILSWKMMDMHLIAASFLGGSEELDGCITPTVHKTLSRPPGSARDWIMPQELDLGKGLF